MDALPVADEGPEDVGLVAARLALVQVVTDQVHRELELA
jgi:hypothetical protein